MDAMKFTRHLVDIYLLYKTKFPLAGIPMLYQQWHTQSFSVGRVLMDAITVAKKRITIKGGIGMNRYVTYDIKDGNSYESLYNYFDDVKAEKITESTYKVSSTLKLEDFCSKLKGLTSSGDSVVVITCNKDGVFHKTVR